MKVRSWEDRYEVEGSAAVPCQPAGRFRADVESTIRAARETCVAEWSEPGHALGHGVYCQKDTLKRPLRADAGRCGQLGDMA